MKEIEFLKGFSAYLMSLAVVLFTIKLLGKIELGWWIVFIPVIIQILMLVGVVCFVVWIYNIIERN